MTLPGDLGTVILTGEFLDPAGNPMRGTVSIQPNATLLDATGNVIVPQFPRHYQLFNGTFTTPPLVGTDNSDINPSGWTYQITVALQEVPSYSFNVALPASGSPVDLSTLSPAVSIPELAGSVPVTGGTITGKLTLTGSTPLQIPGGAASGDVLTSDPSGNASWGPPGVGNAGTGLTKSGSTLSLAIPVAISSGGTESATAAGSTGYAAKASATDAVYYVSSASTASDSNDGLSWGSAKATIAGAMTAIGTTSGATNPATIQLGNGTWALSGTQTITGVTGFIINGLGTEFTRISGPDAAATLSFVNCYRCTVSNLSVLGTPSGTGWGIEQSQNFGSAGVSTRLLVTNVSFGQGGGATYAYGIRWTLYGALGSNDANNDQAVVENCKFNNITTRAISVEHSNSLLHRINNAHFNNCACAVAFQGGSAVIINPIILGGSGWMFDFQAAAGNFAGHGADYYHPTTIEGLQSETSTMGLVRSNASASPQTFYTTSPLQVKFTSGEAHMGNGVSNVVADWENTTSSFLSLQNFSIITANPAAFNVTSASTVTTLTNCLLSLPTLACSGPLIMKGITYPVGSATTISGSPIDYTPAVGANSAVTLTDASSIAVNSALGMYFRVTLGGNRTLANPTNAADGRVMIIEVIQDSGGSRTLSYDTNYAFSTGLPLPTLSTTASGRDWLGFKYNSTAGKWYCLAFLNGF